MLELEREIVSMIRRKGIDCNAVAKKRLCLKVLEHYERQTDMKDEYLGAKLFKMRKLVAKFAG